MDVRVLADDRAAAWVVRRLRDARPGTVASVVGAGFAGYARVLHPVLGPAEPLTWAAVAAEAGVELGPLTGWGPLAARVPGGPAVGTLPPEDLAALCDVLAGHTGTPRECVFAVREDWPGWAELEPSGGGRVDLDGRPHVLVTGALTAAVPLSFADVPGRWWAQSPTLFWPADRAWCVATAPDRQCTLVAGSVALVEDLLAAADLEVWPVAGTDRMPDPA